MGAFLVVSFLLDWRISLLLCGILLFYPVVMLAGSCLLVPWRYQPIRPSLEKRPKSQENFDFSPLMRSYSPLVL